MTYPIVSDINKTISADYGVLAGDEEIDEDGNVEVNGELIAYRGLFLIDKDGIVRHQLINDFPLGRSIDEAIRVVDALQHFELYGEVCPPRLAQGRCGHDPVPRRRGPTSASKQPSGNISRPLPSPGNGLFSSPLFPVSQPDAISGHTSAPLSCGINAASAAPESPVLSAAGGTVINRGEYARAP